MINELYLFNLNSDQFLSNYLPVALFLGVALVVVVALLLASYTITPQNPYFDKTSPYECGFESVSDARNLFNIRFYLVAILFVVFDVEILFLYPWALILKHVTVFGFWTMVLFLAVFILGFIYEYKKGVLEWY